MKIPDKLTELPDNIREAANHGLLYPNVLIPAWEKHSSTCFKAGKTASDNAIINALRKALKTYETKPEQLVVWLTGFCK